VALQRAQVEIDSEADSGASAGAGGLQIKMTPRPPEQKLYMVKLPTF